jgi:hypothetical protein
MLLKFPYKSQNYLNLVQQSVCIWHAVTEEQRGSSFSTATGLRAGRPNIVIQFHVADSSALHSICPDAALSTADFCSGKSAAA